MTPPPSTRRRRLLFGAILILAAILGGFLVRRRGRAKPQPEAVAAFLDQTVGAGKVRFTVTGMGTLREDEGYLQVGVAATARTLLPLYSAADPADYLRRTLGLDPESTAEARRLLADRSSPPSPEITAAGPLPTDPYRATILQLKSATGTPFDFQGVVDARRTGDAWTFSLASGGFEGPGPQGEARSAFPGDAFEAGNAADDARLRALVTGLQAFAGRVTTARQDLDLARTTAQGDRQKAFLAAIAPGQVFQGLATEAGEQVGTPLYLEITALLSDHQVSARLRNNGSWHYARAFQGSWSADDAFEHPVLNLVSLPDQAIRTAGPFLETTQEWSFTLRADPQGGLSEHNPFYQYQFQPLDPGQVPALRSRLEGEFDQALAATAAGSLYQGAALSRDSGASEPILLRFTGRSEGGESVEGRMETATRSWKRPFHGLILSNARRSDGAPVRLSSGAGEADEDAPSGTALGDPDDLNLRLGFEDGSLVGGDERFTYRLAPVGEAELQRLEAGRAERARRFLNILRDGIAYDGILHEDQGSIVYARLEIGRVDARTGTITAGIHARDQLDVCRDFHGTADPAGGSMVLTATDKGVLYPGGTISIPFLMSHAATTLHLALTGNSITGRIEDNPHWTMTFPADTFLSAPPADESRLPPLPKAAGAYLLTGAIWVPLPRNNAHVVVEDAGAARDAGMATRLWTAMSDSVTKEKPKVSYLEFDGQEPRPKSNAPALVLLCVGPESSGEPRVELAPEDTLKDGRRSVEIMPGPPAGIRLGEQRAAAYVRQIAPGAVLLTTTSPLVPGPYVFSADTGYEMIRD